MSVECRVFVGLTLDIARNLTHKDFAKCDEFTNKHPELDEYEYGLDEKEGKLLLIGDGMNGDFLRLIKVDKFIDNASLGDANEFMELPRPKELDPELIKQMFELYEEYTGVRPNAEDFKYATWSQWY